MSPKYSVPIGPRLVGAGQALYLVLEAGATHTGLASARDLALAARRAGADAVKFQIFRDPDRLMGRPDVPFSYTRLQDKASGRTEEVAEPLRDILARRCMPEADWVSLARYCREIEIEFIATAFFPEDVDLLVEMGCASIKIASGDVNHLPLIQYAARTGVALQLDTGNATLGEIEIAVDAVLAQGNDRIIVHHCPSGYPAHPERVNLRVLSTLQAMFDFPIAFSDHTPGWEMDVAAVALGASLIEKTITLDRATPSCEHIFSLEPDQAAEFVGSMRRLEKALGSGRYRLPAEGAPGLLAARRSLFLTRDVRRGERLTAADVDFRRPGTGLPPTALAEVDGQGFVRDLKAGSMLTRQDLQDGED